VRNEKFPVTMKCAGSIFKNLLLRELPDAVAAQVPAPVVRDGKIPAAWFLEQAGERPERGDIRVAPYHANLIYNAGEGTARDRAPSSKNWKTRCETASASRSKRRCSTWAFPELLAAHDPE
jgi:UDP-N-acetylmuramate dehydrogenase